MQLQVEFLIPSEGLALLAGPDIVKLSETRLHVKYYDSYVVTNIINTA